MLRLCILQKIPRLRMPKTTSIYTHSIGNPYFPMLFLLSSSCRAVAMRICSILRHILTTERKKPPLSRRTTKVAYSGGSRASSLATAPVIDRYTFFYRRRHYSCGGRQGSRVFARTDDANARFLLYACFSFIIPHFSSM